MFCRYSRRLLKENDQGTAVGRGGGLGSPVFPLNWFENLLFRGGVLWKRTVLGGGGELLPPRTAPCPEIVKRQVLRRVGSLTFDHSFYAVLAAQKLVRQLR